jgi:hypothetical protein
MNYHVMITTLDGQVHSYDVESKSKSSTLCERLFNQTPNVRSVEVDLIQDKMISPECMDYFEHRFNTIY